MWCKVASMICCWCSGHSDIRHSWTLKRLNRIVHNYVHHVHHQNSTFLLHCSNSFVATLRPLRKFPNLCSLAFYVHNTVHNNPACSRGLFSLSSNDFHGLPFGLLGSNPEAIISLRLVFCLSLLRLKISFGFSHQRIWAHWSLAADVMLCEVFT